MDKHIEGLMMKMPVPKPTATGAGPQIHSEDLTVSKKGDRGLRVEQNPPFGRIFLTEALKRAED